MANPLDSQLQRGQVVSAALVNNLIAAALRRLQGGRGIVVRALPNGNFCLDFVGSLAVGGGAEGGFQIWEAANRAALNALTGPEDRDFGVTTAEVAPDEILYWRNNGTFQRISHYDDE
jgi:hypothetical protein